MSWQQLRRSRLHVDTRCAIADIPLHEVSRALERARLTERQSPLSVLVQPYAYAAARVMGAIRQSPSPLTAIMYPMHTARYSLVKATSICRRIVGHLLPTSSRRDALFDDDASSDTPERKGAP